jgi:hypothetical protein
MSKYYNPIELAISTILSRRSCFASAVKSTFLLNVHGVSTWIGDWGLGCRRVPFSLNSAVDTLLKKEFDLHRAEGTAHPLMEAYGLDAVPMRDERMDEWRDSLRRGVTYAFPGTNLVLTGGVDDVWVTPSGELIIVDYKATSKEDEVTLDAEWQDGYKRQMEIYQWLFRKNGFSVSPTGYFVYCNGDTDRAAFDGKLEFSIKLIPYVGDDGWIERGGALYKCLQGGEIPASGKECDYCAYREAVKRVC